MPDSVDLAIPASTRRDPDGYALGLDFCRECLGWSDASSGGPLGAIVENRRRPESPHTWTKITGFHLDPHDLSHVINAVKQWCDLRGCSLWVAYSPNAPGDRWRVRVAPHADAQGDLPSATLMRACLAADRAIRSQGEKSSIEATPITKNPAIFAEPWGNIRANGPIALSFCKECLAWKDARLINDFGYLAVKEDVPKELAGTPIPPWERSFHFNENHIDKVIIAVCTWCDARATGFTLEYFPSGSAADCWRAAVGPAATCGDLASAALMSACVSAQHRLTLPGKTEGHRDRSNDQP
jgi:hypothetical protein